MNAFSQDLCRRSNLIFDSSRTAVRCRPDRDCSVVRRVEHSRNVRVLFHPCTRLIVRTACRAVVRTNDDYISQPIIVGWIILRTHCTDYLLHFVMTMMEELKNRFAYVRACARVSTKKIIS